LSEQLLRGWLLRQKLQVIDEKLEIIIVSHRILEKYSINLIDHLLIPFTFRLNVQTMETRNEEKFFICSSCFGKISEYMLGNAKLVKGLGLPDHLTVHPVETSDAHTKCERCKVNTADGYIPLAKSEQVVVT